MWTGPMGWHIMWRDQNYLGAHPVNEEPILEVDASSLNNPAKT